MKQKTQKYLYLINMIITAIVFVLAVFVLAGAIFARANNSLPSLFGYTISVVVTPSMEPDILAGDMVIAKKADISEVKLGDYVIFTSPDPALRGKIIIHAVVDIHVSESGVISLTTKGINNPHEDDYPVREIISIFRSRHAFLGKVFTFLSDLRNILFLAVTILVLSFAVKYSVKVIAQIKACGKTKEEEEKGGEEE